MHRFVEHTAELELHLDSESEAGVFEDALAAIAELVSLGAEGEPVAREVALEARDRGALLAGWIDELVFLAETDGLVPEAAEVELAEAGLRATVTGRRGDVQPLVKAATYHGLEFGHEGGRWRARVVLDV